MSRRRKWLFIIAGGIVGIAVCIYLAIPRQPRYQGRALQDWLADLSSPHYETQRLARVAIHEMGPAAIPFLTNSLAQRNALSIRIYRKNLVPRKLAAWSHRVFKWQTPVMESRSAAIALQSLGPDATNAIPALIDALADPSWIVASQAATALGAIGSNAVPALDTRLTVASAQEITWVLQAIAAIGTNAATLAPKVAVALASENPSLGNQAVFPLSRMGAQAVPFITPLLDKTNNAVVVRALTSLMQIGAPAMSATNSIAPLTRSTDTAVRLAAYQTLAAMYLPREVGAPFWLAGLRDPDPRIIETSLRMLTIFPTNVREYNHEIASLASHPSNSISTIASNSLTVFKAWPR